MSILTLKETFSDCLVVSNIHMVGLESFDNDATDIFLLHYPPLLIRLYADRQNQLDYLQVVGNWHDLILKMTVNDLLYLNGGISLYVYDCVKFLSQAEKSQSNLSCFYDIC